jgi:hypothetical protein
MQAAERSGGLKSSGELLQWLAEKGAWPPIQTAKPHFVCLIVKASLVVYLSGCAASGNSDDAAGCGSVWYPANVSRILEREGD